MNLILIHIVVSCECPSVKENGSDNLAISMYQSFYMSMNIREMDLIRPLPKLTFGKDTDRKRV